MERPEAHVCIRGNKKSTRSLPELHLAGLVARVGYHWSEGDAV